MKNALLLFSCLTLSLITQAQVSKSINTTSGHLSTDLNETELASLTNLTVEGTLDARDFRIMRDSMPALAVLDISRVTIEAYSGSEGTFSDDFGGNLEDSISTINNYPANAIPEYAFFSYEDEIGKSSLTSISLPSSLTSIGAYSFTLCNGLNSITIPASVNRIGELAFAACSASISIGLDNSTYSSMEGVLFNKDQTILIQCPSSKEGIFHIPSSVQAINGGAFVFCNKITSVLIPTSVTTIGDGAFYNCTNLETINIPSSLKEMGDNVFSECSKLTSISFPSSMTKIPEGTCSNCISLSSITIPPSVSFIDYDAFYGCTSISAIHLNWMRPGVLGSYSGIFDGLDASICTLYIPYKSGELYASNSLWGHFTKIMEDTEGFLLSSTEESIGWSEGSTANINIAANMAWTAQSDQTWLIVNPTSGTGDHTLLFTAESNILDSTRTATITVSALGKTSQYISVTQESLYYTINESMKDEFSNIECGANASLTSGINDRLNEGWLRLTNDSPFQRGYATTHESFNSSSGVQIDFEFKTWKKDPINAVGDGFSVFLYDAATNDFHIGGFGGSLGYGPFESPGAESTEGLSNGFVGIGFDELGNFSNPTEGRIGGPGFSSNCIGVRGSTPSYPWIAGNSNLPFKLDFGANDQRPSDSIYYRKIRIELKPLTNNLEGLFSLSIKAQSSKDSGYVSIIEPFTLSSLPPEMLKLGFAASTGMSSNYHEIRNLRITNHFDIPQSLPSSLGRGREFTISPNPFTHEISVNLPEGETIDRTEVFDVLGKSIQQSKGSDTKIQINGTDVIYILKVKTKSGKTYSTKLIRQK